MILLLMIFVVTYPLVGAQKGLSDGPRVRIPSKENEWSHHQCLFKENVKKNPKVVYEF